MPAEKSYEIGDFEIHTNVSGDALVLNFGNKTFLKHLRPFADLISCTLNQAGYSASLSLDESGLANPKALLVHRITDDIQHEDATPNDIAPALDLLLTYLSKLETTYSLDTILDMGKEQALRGIFTPDKRKEVLASTYSPLCATAGAKVLDGTKVAYESSVGINTQNTDSNLRVTGYKWQKRGEELIGLIEAAIADLGPHKNITNASATTLSLSLHPPEGEPPPSGDSISAALQSLHRAQAPKRGEKTAPFFCVEAFDQRIRSILERVGHYVYEGCSFERAVDTVREELRRVNPVFEPPEDIAPFGKHRARRQAAAPALPATPLPVSKLNIVLYRSLEAYCPTQETLAPALQRIQRLILQSNVQERDILVFGRMNAHGWDREPPADIKDRFAEATSQIELDEKKLFAAFKTGLKEILSTYAKANDISAPDEEMLTQAANGFISAVNTMRATLRTGAGSGVPQR